MSSSAARQRPSGVLVIDKPEGLTSAQVVSRVKRALKLRRVGHTGTLDPLATGVLPLCLGDATKLAGYLLAEDKAYEAEIELGVETDTLDAEGRVTKRRPAELASLAEGDLREAMAVLSGEMDQVPPMYSSVKQGGARLHELARAGVTVARPPRRVRVDRFERRAFESPRLRVFIECSKGTYVRALARDLGEKLGCGAHVATLRRVRAGAFAIERAISLAEAVRGLPEGALVPPAEALSHLPGWPVPADRVREVANGKVLPWSAFASQAAPEGFVRLLTPGGELLAIAWVAGRELAYGRVFPEVAAAKAP